MAKLFRRPGMGIHMVTVTRTGMAVDICTTPRLRWRWP
jgi:hypothetical protein